MICAITSYFNPLGHQSRYVNYCRFAESLVEQNVPLITAELSADKFVTDAQVKIRSSSVLWHKERLLNLALSEVPSEFDKVAWIDADVLFLNADWSSIADHFLDQYDFVQLFDKIHFTDEWTLGCCVVESRVAAMRHGRNAGANGAAWAARRDALSVGFYEKAIMGGGDSVLLAALLNDFSLIEDIFPRNWNDDLRDWMAQFSGAKVGCIEGSLTHLKHGRRQHRKFPTRHLLLERYGVHPLDVYIDSDGALNVSNEAFSRAMKRYWLYRREDNGSGILFL